MALTRNENANAELAKAMPIERLAEQGFDALFNAPIKVERFANEFEDCNAEIISRANNKNIRVNKSDASLMVQLCVYSASVENSLNEIGKEANRPEWLPVEYSRIVQTNKYNSALIKHNMPLNSFATHDIQSIIYMENLSGSLPGFAKNLQTANKQDRAVEFAADMGVQLASMLDALGKKDILWLDMKPGNLLLRLTEEGKHQIVVADMKGLWSANMLMKKQNGNKVVIDFNEMDTSEMQYSKYFNDHLRDNLSPSDVKQAMEQEYSYQMAVMLYKAATNNDKFTKVEAIKKKSEIKAEEYEFDFNHPSFATPAGRLLKDVITNLSHENPNDRMHYKDAALLLKAIDNEVKYEGVKGMIKEAEKARAMLKTNVAESIEVKNPAPVSESRLKKSFSTKNLLGVLSKGSPSASPAVTPISQAKVSTAENTAEKYPRPKMQRSLSGKLKNLINKDIKKTKALSNETSESVTPSIKKPGR